MAFYYKEPSHTFSEYLLIPNLTKKHNRVENVSLKTPIVRHKRGEKSYLELNIPFSSAIMQSISDDKFAIALGRSGGLSFIYSSQSVEQQAAMVGNVKKYKAGFVISDSNLQPELSLKDALDLSERTGHTTIAITEDGTAAGKLLGVLTSRDYRIGHTSLEVKIKDIMTPLESLVYGEKGITLKEANSLIWENKLSTLPIIDKDQNLCYLVFRKDIEEHRGNPDELIDRDKKLIIGAGINTWDYRERVPALVDAGADIICIDSSDGFSEWQFDAIRFIKERYNGEVKVGAGNIVDREGFLYLAEAGADFIKVGIGGGATCITREQKGIGRGQASALIEVSEARDEYLEQMDEYIPICSDGAIVHDYHITIALAMGADFVMLGRYFARFDETPAKKLRIRGNYVKEYWGEGSLRARNWQRYIMDENMNIKTEFEFEEGIDGYVPYAGKMKDNLNLTIKKIKSTMCNCGALTLEELRREARLTLVSATSIREGGVHDMFIKESSEIP